MANKAEVRRGALSGPFLELVIELAKDIRFTELTPVSEKQLKEREREELVTRFFAYGDGLDDYADEVSPFLFAYSKKMNTAFSENPTLHEQYRLRFQKTMDFVAKAFPYGFRRTPKGKVSPRSRFEALAIGTYLALLENPSLEPNQDKILKWLSSEDFRGVTGADGANGSRRLEGRLYFVRDHLLGKSNGNT